MNRPFVALCALALLALISLAAPVYAQTAAVAARPTTGPFSYDISRETTLTGTVSSVVMKPSAGMIMGAHLMVATSSGMVDASLASAAFSGKGALSLTPGQQVQLTGIMKTLIGRQVFLVRTVTADGQVYAIRNARGVPISPRARERQSQSDQQRVQP